MRVGEDGILLDGNTGRLSSATYASGLSGWVIDRNGNSEFNNAKIRGQIESAIFVQNEIHAQGGTMLVRPAGTLRDAIDYSGTEPFDITVENPASGHYPMFNQDDILRIKMLNMTHG